jgi:hypothetical protein
MPVSMRSLLPRRATFGPVRVTLLALCVLHGVPGFCGTPELAAQDARQTTARTVTSETEALLLTALRAGAVTAEAAARELLRFTTVDAPRLARVLHAAEHAPRDIQVALERVLQIPSAEAQLVVRNATATRLVMDRDPARIEGRTVDFCVDRMGELFTCPAGSPITGATVTTGIAPSSMNWSGVTLSPANDAPAGGSLVIRPPPGATLPTVEVRYGDQVLQVLSASSTEVRVALPSEPGERPLMMNNLDAGLSGTLASPFRVRPTGLLEAVPAHATSHDWTTTYLLARVSHFVYSDALGSPSQHRNAFRNQMTEWGMWGVEFVENRDQHVMAAVIWGRDLVLVVFRGSESHTTTHCFLQVFDFGVCAGYSTNWLTNLSYRPMQPRPAWGEGVAVHPGFVGALDLVHAGIRDRVAEVLTSERRLFVAGHSLGGALATLFAFRVAAEDGLPVQGVYTFGAPRVGNVPFAVRYERLVGARTHRWQNRSDPAPAVPPGQPFNLAIQPLRDAVGGRTGLVGDVADEVGEATYRHVGRLHYLPRTGPAEINRSSEPFQLATSRTQLTADDHRIAGTSGSYVTRLFPNLPASVMSQMPPPPATPSP